VKKSIFMSQAEVSPRASNNPETLFKGLLRALAQL
jgi:hypothetical protein